MCRATGGSINQYAAEHSQAVAGGIPILALDMYEHAYHIDFGANAKAYVDAYMRNIDWKAVARALRGRCRRWTPPRPLVQPEFGDLPGVTVEEVKAMLDAGKPVQFIDARPTALRLAHAGHHAKVPPGATPSA